LEYLIRFGISGKYGNDSCKYCGDAFNRLGVCNDVLDAHLTGTAVLVPVPQDVREVFERMKLFKLTRSSHAE
jgi:hypothetical protein